jgi:hypothetical protein
MMKMVNFWVDWTQNLIVKQLMKFMKKFDNNITILQLDLYFVDIRIKQNSRTKQYLPRFVS